MDWFRFWRRWLIILGWGLAAFGLALALFNQSAPFNLLFNDRINPVFWPAGALPPEARAFQQWAYGVQGAVLCGWAIFIAFLSMYAFPLHQRWVWWCFVIGLSVWFVIDTAISLCFGVGFNALVNLLLFVALAVPLLLTRRAFIR